MTEWRKKWDKWLHSFTNAVLNTSLQSDLVLLCFCPFLHGLFPSVHFWTGSFLLSVSEQAFYFCLFLNGLFPSRLSHYYMLHWLKQEILSCLLGVPLYASLSSELLSLYLPAEQRDGCLGSFDLGDIPIEGTFCPQVSTMGGPSVLLLNIPCLLWGSLNPPA